MKATARSDPTTVARNSRALPAVAWRESVGRITVAMEVAKPPRTNSVSRIAK